MYFCSGKVDTFNSWRVCRESHSWEHFNSQPLQFAEVQLWTHFYWLLVSTWHVKLIKQAFSGMFGKILKQTPSVCTSCIKSLRLKNANLGQQVWEKMCVSVWFMESHYKKTTMHIISVTGAFIDHWLAVIKRSNDPVQVSHSTDWQES